MYVLRLLLLSSGAAFANIAELEKFSHTADNLNWQFYNELSVTAPDQRKAFSYPLNQDFNMNYKA